jgi:hypothetical protein
LAFDAGTIDATLTLNRNPFTAGIAAAKAEARKLEREGISVPIRTTLDRTSLQKVKAQIERAVSSITVRARLEQASLARIRQQISRVVGRIDVRLNLSASDIAALRARISAIRATVRVDIDVDDAALNNLRGRIRGFGNDAGNAFNGAGSRFRLMASLIIGLAPVIGSALVGIVGAAGALGSAFGVLLAGVSAFALVAAPAFKAINEATKQNTKTAQENAAAQKAVRNAQYAVTRARENAAQNEIQSARAIGDAQRALVRAREDAAEGAIRAARAVADAQENLRRTQEAAAESAQRASRAVAQAERGVADAQRTAQRAQEDLNRARRDAIEELEDLKLALRGGALSEEQAMLDLEAAQLRFNEAVREGTKGNELKQLELNVRQASLAVDEARERYGDLQEESAEWAKTGVEGSRGVKDAQEALNDANQGVKDSEQALADARLEQARDARDSQRAIADAQRDVADARAEQAKQAIEGQHAIQDAERNLAEVQADAARQRLEDQRAIADAIADLRDTQSSAIDEAISKYNELSPAMRRAADALSILKGQFKELQKATEEAVADAFIANFRAAGVLLGSLAPIINSTAKGFETIGQLMEMYFGSPEWLKFRDFVASNISPVMIKFFLILAYGTQGVMNLIQAFKPLTDWMLDALVGGMMDFANWSNSLSDNPRFIQFLERAKIAIPAVLEFLGKFIRFIWDLSVALEPAGTLVLKFFSMIFDAVNMLSPDQLALVIGGIGILIGIFAGGLISIAGWAIGIAGVVAALGHLYSTNEQVRSSVDGFLSVLRDAFLPIWNTIADAWQQRILPALQKLWIAIKDNILPVFTQLWQTFEAKVLPNLQSLIDTIFNQLIPAFLDWFTQAQPVIAWFLDIFGNVLLVVFNTAVQVIDGALQAISGLFTFFVGVFTGDWEKMGEGLRMIWEGLWKAIQAILQGAWDLILVVIGGAITALDNAWRRVANIFRDPINWVINVVVNDGILGAWNQVMSWIGAPGLKAERVPELPMFAEGGVVPGYAPRRDTELAAVSPGEAIMVPEWTRAIGEKNVHNMNRIARTKGSGALARMMAREGDPTEVFSVGGIMGRLPRFAYGGVMNHVAFAGAEIERLFGRMPGGIGGVGARANASDHPKGLALDFMTMSNRGLGDRVEQHLYANANRLALKYNIWLQRIRYPGGGWRGMANRGSPTANHMDHVHSSFMPKAGMVGTDPGGGGFVMPDFIGMMTGLFQKLLNFSGFPGKGLMGDAVKQIPTKLIERVMAAARAKIEAWMASMFTTGVAGNASAAGGAAGAGVQAAVNAVASRYGWGQGTPEWNALSFIIQKESGWDPTAANSRSSARGLFQKMTSMHGPVEPSPGGQAEWGLRYIAQRYGTPSKAWAFHKANGHYDNGGWLEPGTTLATNATGRPERILSHNEYNDIQRSGASPEEIAAIVRGVLSELGSGGGDTYNIQLPQQTTVRELADTIDFRKRVSGKGRYSR